MLNIVRTFHCVSKSPLEGNKALNFAVCNMFVEENGTVSVEKTIQLALDAFLENKTFGERALHCLVKEVGNFLNVTGVCEVELSHSVTCSTRSVQSLTSLYATLVKSARVLTSNNLEDDNIFQSILESTFDAIDLTNNVPCLHPVAIWENLLSAMPLYNQSTAGKNIPSPKVMRQIFGLIETNVAHFNDVSHPPSTKWKFSTVNGSRNDSDSAFYASDASETQNSDNIHDQPLLYLTPYTRFLSSDFDDFSYPTFLSVKEMLNHLSQVLSVASKCARVEILSAVLLPSLELKLKKIKRYENVTPNEIDLLLVQRILSNIKNIIKSKDGLNACHQQRIFPIVISARDVEWLSDEVFRFTFHFVDQELRLITNSLDSQESTFLQAATKGTVNGEEVCHANAVFQIFASNSTLKDVLLLLESKSEEFVTASTLSLSCLSETAAMWNLQVNVTSEETMGQYSHTVRILFLHQN